jgi:hypothetical protein
MLSSVMASKKQDEHLLGRNTPQQVKREASKSLT